MGGAPATTAMAGMGLLTSLLAPALVLLTRAAALWRLITLPAPVALAGFTLLHAAVAIGMTFGQPAALTALAKPVLLAGAVLFWLPVLGPSARRLSGAGCCIYLFLAGPALDLAGIAVIARGDPRGGIAMMVAMLPIGIAAMGLTWKWVTNQERMARAAEQGPGQSPERSVPQCPRRRPLNTPGHAGESAGQTGASALPRGWYISRRGLRMCLGGLWISAAALQAQPFMFTPGFGRDVLAPAAAGQPHWLGQAIQACSAIVEAHPAAANAAFVAVQAVIGVALLSGWATRAALFASIGWAAAVWLLGEGLGGLLSGSASVRTGPPGAALAYAALAAAALPARGRRRQRERLPERLPERQRERPPGWLPAVWAALWLLVPLTQPWPARLSFTSAVIVGQMAVAAAAVRPGIWRDAAVALGAGQSLAAWVAIQHFGGLASGQATDIGAGPPLALLAFAVWSAGRRESGPTAAWAVRGRIAGPAPAHGAGPMGTRS